MESEIEEITNTEEDPAQDENKDEDVKMDIDETG